MKNKKIILVLFMFLFLKPVVSYGLSESNHLPVTGPFKKSAPVNSNVDLVLNSLVRDVDGDALTFTIISLPKHGVLTLEKVAQTPRVPKGSLNIVGVAFTGYPSFVRYVPDKDFVGADEFLFSVSDGKGESQTGKVQLVIGSVTPLTANKPPLVTHGVYKAYVGKSLPINARSLTSDPDGDSLVISFNDPNKFQSAFSRFNYGKVHFNADVFDYLPSMEGVDRFEYVVDDGHHQPVVGTIEVHNEAYPLSRFQKYFVWSVCFGFKIFFILGLIFLSVATLKRTSAGGRILQQTRWLENIVFPLYALLKRIKKGIAACPFLWIFLMFNVAYLYYHYCRTTLSPWDFDYQYCHIYDFFKRGVLPPDHGDVYFARFLPIFLASLIPGNDPSFGFWIVNFVLMNITIFIFYRVWKLLSIKTYLMFFAFFWLCFHPFGIVVLYGMMPLVVDMGQYAFYAALIYIIIRRKYGLLLILVPIVGILKETALTFVAAFLPFAYFQNKWVQSDKEKIPLRTVGVSFVLGLLGKIFISYWIISGSHTLTENVVRMAWFQFLVVFGRDFEYGIVWIIIQFYSFGGLLLLGLDRCKEAYKNNTLFNSLIYFSFLSLFVSLFLSGTAERSSFYAFPFVMTLILLLINNLSPRFVTIIFILSLPLLTLYAVRPFDDVFFFDMARQYDRMNLHAIYIFILWQVIRYRRGINTHDSI